METKNFFEQNLVEVLFYVDKNKETKKSDERLIYGRFKLNDKLVQISTGIKVDPLNWNTELHRMDKGNSKMIQEINSSLALFAKKVNTCYIELTLKLKKFDVAILKRFITTGTCKVDPEYTSLLEYFRHFNELTKKRVGVNLGHRTFTRYELAYERLKAYIPKQYEGAEDILFEDLNSEFVESFYIELRREYKIAHNTALKCVEKLLTVINHAKDNIKDCPVDSIKYKFTWEEIDRDILNDDELMLICEKRLVSERLEEIRDYFIFACFTGICYIDLYNLTYDDILKDKTGQYIDFRRQKTKSKSVIMLLDIPLLLIEKYRNHPKKKPGKVFPVISNQKINDYLKEIAVMCGIKKELTFHVARHTFATTVSLCQGLPLETLQKVLGHKSIRSTQVYAKVVHKKLSEDMGKLSSKINEMNIQLNLNNE